MNNIDVSSIIIPERIRKDCGDISGLQYSIKEFGLIEPIVLAPEGKGVILVAGGRRLQAMTALGVEELVHGIHFIWLAEQNNDPYRRAAIELEENLRRQDLSWQEQVFGKKKLLEIMQTIHGEAKPGAPTRFHASSGFGVNKLAAMIGETPQATSKDLIVAKMVEALPALAKEQTKAGVLRKFNLVKTLVSLQEVSVNQSPQERLWELYEGPFQENSCRIQSESIDLIYTDLPFGVNLGDQFRHGVGESYPDLRNDIVSLLERICQESYRVLKPNSFCVFFFGFNYYQELDKALTGAGFKVNNVPFIWHHPGPAPTQNPYTRYGNQYDPAFVAYKGSPQFVRPGRSNLISIPCESNKLYIAQQPEALVQSFIFDMTFEGASVVDWMCGSGTTGVAAVKLKRRAILFEQNPAAIAIAKSRLEVIE